MARKGDYEQAAIELLAEMEPEPVKVKVDSKYANKTAPDGSVWVCLACGKRSNDQYGTLALTPGWDESCALNCELYREDRLVLNDQGLVVEIKGEVIRIGE